MRRSLPLLASLLLCPSLLRPSLLSAEEITAPVDLGIGPAAHWFTGDLGRDQIAHSGVKISLAAILDHDFIAAHINRVPKQYQAMALGFDEYRYRPSILIPDSLTISPKVAHTGMYGATWRPVALDLPLARRQTNLDLSLGLILTYTFIHSDVFASTHLLRPGIDLTLHWEIPVTDAFLLSMGWMSQFYVPQKIGGGVFEMGGWDDKSIWHVGQVFLMLHFRFDYTTDI